MAYCPSCGKEVRANHNFCAVCGAAQPRPGGAPEQGDFLENKGMAVISYIFLLSLISYFAAPNSRYVRFHAIQGINLMIFEGIYAVSVGIVTAAFRFIPFFGVLVSAAASVLWIGFFVLMIIGIVNAVNGEMKELPIIGKLKIINR